MQSSIDKSKNSAEPGSNLLLPLARLVKILLTFLYTQIIICTNILVVISVKLAEIFF